MMQSIVVVSHCILSSYCETWQEEMEMMLSGS
jgi:hypothetical protein